MLFYYPNNNHNNIVEIKEKITVFLFTCSQAFLGSPYHLHIISTPLEANAGPGEDTPTFPQVEAAFLMDYKTQATRVWPRVILDYMRHQLRFKGRTKKSTKKGYIWRFTV